MTTFSLNETSVKPDLFIKTDLNFTPKTATRIITPTEDGYFDNASAYTQFIRLMTLIRFSKIMK